MRGDGRENIPCSHEEKSGHASKDGGVGNLDKGGDERWKKRQSRLKFVVNVMNMSNGKVEGTEKGDGKKRRRRRGRGRGS